MENAVVYARFSSSGQQEQSIEGQVAAAQEYAKKHGYQIVHEYCDRAKTGRNDNRDEFQQMLADCAKKQFTVIITWKVDRIGRNREEIALNKYRAKKHGVRVEYVAENISQGPEGVILESVLEGMAEYYSLQLSQNVKRGLLESAKKHHVLGGRLPLGYRMAPDKTFEIDPDTAPIAKKIFEMYASGSTMSELIRWLNERGYRTSKGYTFTKNSLPKMLANEKYIGTYTYKDLIHDENAIPAIIDKATFEKVQEMLQRNRRMPSHRWSYSDYLLTDKLYCGHCGSMMVGTSGNGKMGVKYSYYTCKNHLAKICEKKSVSQGAIEEAVLRTIKEIVFNDETISEIADRVWEYYEDYSQDTSEVDHLKRQLDDVLKAESNLVRSIEAGIINDMIKARLDELTAREKQLRASIAESNLQSGFTLTKDALEFFLLQFKNYDLSDRKQQHRLVDTFVNSIYLYDDHLTINFNYSEGTQTVSFEKVSEINASESSSAVCDGTLQNRHPSNRMSIFFRHEHYLNPSRRRWMKITCEACKVLSESDQREA